VLHSSSLLVSTLPPSAAQKRAALAVSAALFAFFLCVLPFGQQPMGRLGAIIPAVSTVMFLADCISAILLFGQFAVLRSRELLVLAAGYLFTGVLVVPYALTFPGAFSESGLLGASLQSAALIFGFWHVGLPISVIAYALLRDAPTPSAKFAPPCRPRSRSPRPWPSCWPPW
jgi:two-component system sensor histidine kinase/response regulator